jgi:hypothetical protein
VLPTSGKAVRNLEHRQLPKRRALLKLEGGRSQKKYHVSSLTLFGNISGSHSCSFSNSCSLWVFTSRSMLCLLRNFGDTYHSVRQTVRMRCRKEGSHTRHQVSNSSLMFLSISRHVVIQNSNRIMNGVSAAVVQGMLIDLTLFPLLAIN